MSALQVGTFARCIRGKEYFDTWVVPECFLRFHPLFATHTPVNYYYRFRASDEDLNLVLQISQRVAMLREDNELLTRSRS